MIDSAVMRCGTPTSMTTPEFIMRAKEALSFTLLDLLNRGVPIFMVKRMIQGLEPAKWKYNLDESTYDIFDLNWRQYNHNIMTPSGGYNPVALQDYNWYTFATATEDYFTLSQPQPTYINYFGLNSFNNVTASFVIEATQAANDERVNWLDYPIDVAADWISVAFGNGIYVAIAFNSSLVAVADPVNLVWQVYDTGIVQNWTKIKWTGQYFLAVAEGSDLAIKTVDGVNWQEENLLASGFWTDIVTDEQGKIIIIDSNSNGYLYTDNFGISWNALSFPIVANWVAGASNGMQFVVISGIGNQALFSYDGINWNETTLPYEQRWSSVCFGENGYIAVCNDVTNQIAISVDGQTWKPNAVPIAAGFNSITYANQKYVIVAPDTNLALFSYDGALWQTSYLPEGVDWVAVAGSVNGFVACGNGDTTAALGSDQFVKWVTLAAYDNHVFIDGEWLWVDLDNSILTNLVRIRILNSSDDVQLRGFYVGSLQNVYEIVCAKMNRDDFFSFPNKGMYGSPLNYYFYKGTVPQLQLWQSATEGNCFKWAISTYILKSPTLDLNLPLPLPDVPQWYIDGIIWLLASKLCFEVPDVSPERVNMLQQMADKFVNQMEASNSDTSTINLIGAGLSQYSR